jgi:hypothetical protein
MEVITCKGTSKPNDQPSPFKFDMLEMLQKLAKNTKVLHKEPTKKPLDGASKEYL